MGGRYVYLIFYGTPIFFRGVCARYDSGIHFPIALYLTWVLALSTRTSARIRTDK